MFPTHRPRRLRHDPRLRDLVRETRLDVEDLIYPLFVEEGRTAPEEIATLPGQFRHSLDSLREEAARAASLGVRAVMLFGIPRSKDPEGSQAYAPDGIVQQALRALREDGLPLLLIGDVCLCEYTSHGHCGRVADGEVLNDPSLELLVRTAVSQVEAGAGLIAPSDMMDGRIGAIRSGLDGAGHSTIPIMSYAAKYSSAFYGPFRDAAGSAPQFGDRSSYQMDPCNVREALKEVAADLEEGADIVMVKPALAYLDVIRAVKQATSVPVAAYNVSGEYALLEMGAAQGLIDRRRGVFEVLHSIKRAGADLILTYHAPLVAQWLRAG